MKFVLASLAFCAMSFNAFAQEEMFSESATEVRTEAPSPVQSARTLKGVIGLGLSGARSLKFDNATVTNQYGRSFDGNASFNMDRSYAIEFGVQQVPAEGWGYNALLSYESRIRFTTYDESYSAGNFNGAFGVQPNLDLLTLAGNAVYGSDRFFFPVGLNYTLPTYTMSITKNAVNGGLGFQAGVGMYALDNLTLELSYQRKILTLKESYASGTMYNYREGAIEGFGLQARMLY